MMMTNRDKGGKDIHQVREQKRGREKKRYVLTLSK